MYETKSKLANQYLVQNDDCCHLRPESQFLNCESFIKSSKYKPSLNKHIFFLEKFKTSMNLNIFQVNRRIYKGIPDSLRGEVWYRLLDIGRVKQEQNGVYEV